MKVIYRNDITKVMDEEIEKAKEAGRDIKAFCLSPGEMDDLRYFAKECHLDKYECTGATFYKGISVFVDFGCIN